MNKVLILVIFLIFGAGSVFAQSEITFPIPELGNCNNVQTCKVYCDQEENKDACIDFAKSKGLHKSKVNEKQVELLSFAKTELGCETLNACKLFCAQQENYTHCQQFAQNHGLAQAPTSPAKDELLAKAKQNLNCDSFESCRALCDQQENYTKCAALMQDQVTSDDRAMFEKYKPQIKQFLGCDSLVTCMAFCMNPANMPKCQELGNQIGSSEQVPSESPEVWCPKVSSECKWDGTNCVCNGPQTCQQAPGCSWDGSQCNCQGTTTETTAQEPGSVWCPKIGPYCVWDGSSCTCWDDCVKAGGKWTGQKCEYPGSTPESPEVWCPKIEPGCNWDGKQCTCPGTTTGTSTQNNLSPPTPEPGEVWCPKNPGCSWTGTECLCTPTEVPQTPAPSPQVKGVSTTSLWENIIRFFLKRN